MVKVLQADAEPIPGYRLTRYLGRGGFGEVWEAVAPGGLLKAVKLAPMEHNDSTANSRELEGLQKIRSIRHPYLLSIERYEIIDEGYLVIIMELADKSLADRINECHEEGNVGIPRDELLGYMREAAEVLDVLNEQHGLQHMDVKPENLFLSSGHVKVADFGLVQPRNSSVSASALAISPPYAPPELFDGVIEASADQYGLAVTYQELLTGLRPYAATDVRGLMLAHLREKPDLSPLPPGDRSIVSRALQRDPSQRFSSCSEFISAVGRVVHVAAEDAVQPAREPLGRRKTVKTLPHPLVDDQGKARPLFVRHQPIKDRKKVDTVPITPQTTKPAVAGGQQPSDSDNEVRATFVAYLPLELFAHKLRGFIDALDAEIINCTDEKTVLRFRSRGWFGFRSPKGVFMELDTCSRVPNSGYRVVDTLIWSTNKNLRGAELGRRGMLLIACLKAFLMAVDPSSFRLLKPDSQLRAEIVD